MHLFRMEGHINQLLILWKLHVIWPHFVAFPKSVYLKDLFPLSCEQLNITDVFSNTDIKQNLIGIKK